MQKCIICQKQTEEKNASEQPVHETCMKSYSESVMVSIRNLQSQQGENWNKPEGSDY